MEQQTRAPPDMRKVVNFLRGSGSGMKTRVGVLNGKRVDYFKGKSAVKALLSPAYEKLKGVPKATNETEALGILAGIIPYAFYLRVERGQPSGSGANSPKHLQVVQMQLYKPEEYYAWFYEGPQWTTYVGAIGMVAVMLAAVMFPLWPPKVRLGVWYLSIGMLGLIGVFFAIAIVRLIFYIITIIVTPPGIWIFPKLFADVGFVDSFIPFWEWDLPKKKKSKKRREVETNAKGEKGSGTSTPANEGSARIEEVEDDSTDYRAPVQSARIEEVPDDSSA